MKIRIIKGVVAGMAARSEGEELEVADREGRQLIANGKAVEVLTVKVEPEKVRLAPKKKTVKRKQKFD